MVGRAMHAYITVSNCYMYTTSDIAGSIRYAKKQLIHSHTASRTSDSCMLHRFAKS